MRGRLMKLIKRTALLLAVVIVTLFAVRVYISQSGSALLSRGTPTCTSD